MKEKISDKETWKFQITAKLTLKTTEKYIMYLELETVISRETLESLVCIQHFYKMSSYKVILKKKNNFFPRFMVVS